MEDEMGSRWDQKDVVGWLDEGYFTEKHGRCMINVLWKTWV